MKLSIYDQLRKCNKSPAWNRASAYVIMRGWELVGRINVARSKDGMGTLKVFLWDWTDKGANRSIQFGRASGCGYDKLASALSGMTFGSITLTEGYWKTDLRDAGYNLIQAL